MVLRCPTKGNYMHRTRFFYFSFFALLLAGRLAQAQAFFSYVDDNGVKVFTNIPPKNAPREQNPPPSPEVSPSVIAASSSSVPVTRFDPIIKKYASQYRIDPSLIRSMIATESGFNERAVSRKGARGLMQLMPATAARVGVYNTLDPDQNIRGGVLHMRSLLDAFNNNLPLSLAAYNAGENLVQRLGRIPNIRETHDYVRSVTQKYGKTELSIENKIVAPMPSMYRFMDEEGILHLTNIPPVQRLESDGFAASERQ
jgi:soluble lytic murein transglycosylase-like protein